MTQEQKDILFKDLSCRIPYDVKCKIEMWVGCDVCTVYNINSIGCIEIVEYCDTNGVSIERVKPYLFPLSSMTEEQRKEYERIIYKSIELHWHRYYDVVDVDDIDCLIDFYHKNHIDYRGLIPMGLAEDATNKNIY